MYVGDLNHRISVFTTDGQFLTSFMRPEYHSGLAVDASGVVCMCDSENNHIQLFYLIAIVIYSFKKLINFGLA